ncbi:MAG: beta-N-acetylhexosaminidase [Halioglobus sp.]|nr:beta-N-acetylhexosaminidase [Halioglobus sp.]
MSAPLAIASDSAALSLVPVPQRMERPEGEFALHLDATLYTAPVFRHAPRSLRLLLSPATGFTFERVADSAAAAIRVLHDGELGPEAYVLRVGAGGVDITAAADAGVFYALQTLRQLLPTDVYSQTPVERQWAVPFVAIEDAPRFGWRGLHLDVGRHFMPVDFVKRYIDLLAAHKMNRFHWHLTEDQGWRIEIRQYPKLTEIGSVRAQTVQGFPGFSRKELGYDGTPHGGFYTQEEVREVVAYAAQRHVTVVPEIEFPGHAQAAIASYPELGNTGKQLKVKEEWGISKNTLKPSDETLQFYRNVLTEVMALFPSEYIHIGGDEAPKDQWEESPYAQQRIRELGLANENELQSWLIQQMDDFLSANGRRLVGWDEIMQGGLSSNATVMSWRGMAPGAKAARQGHDVIMAPTTYTYFDYYQGDDSKEPTALPFYLPLREVYSFEPIPAKLPPEFHRHILGGQGQLWTEMMKTPEHVEYMAYPRAVALSEVLWSSPAGRNYEEFLPRLDAHLQRLDRLQVNYRPPGDDELTLKGKIKQLLFKAALRVYLWWNGH